MGAQLRLRLERSRTFRREDFILSEVNAEAVRAIDRWPNWHGGALALVGPAGAGKTHLAKDWAASHGADIMAGDAPGDTIAQRVVSLANAPRPVLLEDADRLRDDESLFHLINQAARPEGGLLITARTLPAAWPCRLPDLRSRLNALLIAELGPPDDVILSGVLRALFRERSIRASDDLVSYLVRRIDRSIPEVERVVARLDETADQEGRPVNRALARQIFGAEAEADDLFDDL